MRRYVAIMEYMPAVVFLTIAAFFASRIVVAFFPSEPLAWLVFLNLAPFWREFGVLYATPTLVQGALVANAFYMIGAVCLVLAQKRHMRRTRFVCFHLALVALVYGMNDEKVWIVSNGAAGAPIEYSLLPNFTQISAMTVWLFFGVLVSCIATHGQMIRRFYRRHGRAKHTVN